MEETAARAARPLVSEFLLASSFLPLVLRWEGHSALEAAADMESASRMSAGRAGFEACVPPVEPRDSPVSSGITKVVALLDFRGVAVPAAAVVWLASPETVDFAAATVGGLASAGGAALSVAFELAFAFAAVFFAMGFAFAFTGGARLDGRVGACGRGAV
eukprot:scaffold304_cov248-Pinguiococcus_pyrenoidosus.AAC.26